MITINPNEPGNKPRSASRSNLVGKWFHSMRDGRINWQGKVLADVSDGMVLIQLFSFLDGEPTQQQIQPIAGMSDWLFYDTNEDMLISHRKHCPEFYRD